MSNRTGKRIAKQVLPRSEPLVKDTLADRLREEIVSGALKPGSRIVEGVWGRTLGVAQGSIREAINILAQEGFVAKAAGRSARVVSLSEDDVLRLYELRGALEGLAGRLAAEHKVDTGNLQEAVDRMRRAAKRDRATDLLDADLAFHMELCRLSQNSFLLEHARRILLPFFAFVRIRVVASGQGTGPWNHDLEVHQRIHDLILDCEGRIVEQYIQQVMTRFAATAYGQWEKKAQIGKRGEHQQKTGRKA
jgi:DNA-binding GntR family transcriptional regulator